MLSQKIYKNNVITIFFIIFSSSWIFSNVDRENIGEFYSENFSLAYKLFLEKENKIYPSTNQIIVGFTVCYPLLHPQIN